MVDLRLRTRKPGAATVASARAFNSKTGTGMLLLRTNMQHQQRSTAVSATRRDSHQPEVACTGAPPLPPALPPPCHPGRDRGSW